jgi:hypothetical protein
MLGARDRFSHVLNKERADRCRCFLMHWTINMERDQHKGEVPDHLPFVANFEVF